MTEQEKELEVFLRHEMSKAMIGVNIGEVLKYIARALLEKYPQITKKPVKIPFDKSTGYFMYVDYEWNELNTLEERIEWIDTHFVEVEG